MTYQKIKEKVVDENNWISAKQLRLFILRLSLAIFLLGLMLAIATISIAGSGLAFVSLVLTALMFIWVCDYAISTESSFKFMYKFVRLWFLLIIPLAGLYLVLVYLNFI